MMENVTVVVNEVSEQISIVVDSGLASDNSALVTAIDDINIEQGVQDTAISLNTAKATYPSADALKVANLPLDQNSVNSNIESRVLANDGKISYPKSASDKLATIEANAKDDQIASEVPITDAANNFTATNVEGALAELASVTGVLAVNVKATTGGGAYDDTQYTTGAPFALAVLDGSVNLPNNAGIAYISQVPSVLTNGFYNLGKIQGYNNSFFNVTMEFSVRPTTASSDICLKTSIDIGGTVGEIYPRNFTLSKGSGIEHFYSASFLYYTRDTFELNGGLVKVSTENGPVAIYNIRYVFAIQHYGGDVIDAMTIDQYGAILNATGASAANPFVTTSQLSGLSGSFQKVDDYTALIAVATPTKGDLVYVTDTIRYGLFKYNSALSGVNNNGTIISGWVREEPNIYKLRYWGAIGDGITDDTAAFTGLNAAIGLNGFDPFTSVNEKIEFEPNKRYYTTIGLDFLNRDNVIVEGNNAVILYDGTGVVLNLRNLRNPVISNLKASVLNDVDGVIGMRLYKTYHGFIENVQFHVEEISTPLHTFTKGFVLVAGQGDGGDNLYPKFNHTLARKLGYSYWIETPDPLYTRNNSVTFDNATSFSRVGLYIEGTSSVKFNQFDVEGADNPFIFKENPSGVASSDNVIDMIYYENATGVNLIDPSCAGNKFSYQFGTTKPIIPYHSVSKTRFDNKRAYGQSVLYNPDFAWTTLKSNVWFKVESGASTVNFANTNKATITVVAGATAWLYQGFHFEPDEVYTATVSINGTAGKLVRFSDDVSNLGGLISTQNTIALTGVPQELKFTWKANAESTEFLIARADSGDYTYDITNVDIKKLLSSENAYFDNTGTTIVGETVFDAITELDARSASGGESNTVTNVGAGAGLAKSKDGVDIPMKSIVAGTNITITEGTDIVTINGASGAGSGDFLADGTIPMTGDLNLGGNELNNGAVVGETFGAEKVINGTFDTDTSWGGKVNAVISGGVATLTIAASGNASIQSNIFGITVGNTYELTFDLTGSESGQAIRVFDGNNNGALTTGNGQAIVTTTGALQQITKRFVATANSTYVLFTRNTNTTPWSYTIDNVSLKEVIPATGSAVLIGGGLITDGNVESAGILLTSPDLTRYIITVANGGTLVVTPE